MKEREVASSNMRANLSSAFDSALVSLPVEQQEYEAKLRISLLQAADDYLRMPTFERQAELGRVLAGYRHVGDDLFLVQVCAALRKELKVTRPILKRMLRDAKAVSSQTTAQQQDEVQELFALFMDSFQRPAPKKKNRQRMTDAAFKNNRRALRNAADFRPKQLTGNPIALFDDFDYLRAHGMGVSPQADEPQSAG